MISDSVPAQPPEPQPLQPEPGMVRPARPRWLLPVVGAVILVAAVIGVVVGLTLTGNRGGGAAPAAGYVPSNASMYYELRMGLSSDQATSLRTFLKHFPGVDPEKLLTTQLEEQLDKASLPTSSGLRYTTDVKPWFDGTLAVALIGYPSMVPSTGSATPPSPDYLFFAGVKDQAAAGTFSDHLKSALTADHATVTSSSHGSATIWSSTPLADRSIVGTGLAWTVTSDEIILAPSAALVGQALDVRSGAKPALSDRQEFRDGLARLSADRELTFAADPATLFNQLKTDLASQQPAIASAIDSLSASLPHYEVLGGRMLGDRISVEGDVVFDSGAGLPANRDRGLSALAPGDAIFFADQANVGDQLAKFVKAAKSAMAAAPAQAAQLQQVESVLGGSLESFVSWMGDAAFVAGSTAGEPYFGLIVTPTDAAAARTKLAQIRGLLELAAGSGSQVSVTDTDHNGTKITTIRVKAGSDVPTWAITYQYAVTDQRVVIGNRETFVTRVLDMTKANSLAATGRFSQAMSALGASSNSGEVWLDLTALRAAVEQALPAEVGGSYRAQVQPYLVPFDYLAAASRTDGSHVVSDFALVVK